MTPQELKNSILQLAIQGKLVEQRPEEGTAEGLYKQIQAEKQALIKAGKIKKEKPLPEITEDEIPFEIPESWKWVRLNSVISLLSGSDLTPDKYNAQNKGIPYITGASNIEGNSIIINRWTEYPNNIAHCGDLLLTCKGTVGKTSILAEKEVHIARQIMAITPILVDTVFIQRFIECQVDNLKSKAKSMIPGIERDNVLKLALPLPPLAEQKRIVAKIEELLPLIERYEKAWSRLEDFNKRFPGDMQKSILQMAIQGKLVEQRPEEGTGKKLAKDLLQKKNELVQSGKIMKKASTKPFYTTDELNEIGIPDTWCWVQLADVSLIQEGAGIRKWQYRESGTQILCVTNILDGAIDIEKKKLYISSKEYLEKYQHLTPQVGDIVSSCSGGSWGKTAIFNCSEIMMLNTSTLRLRFFDDLASNAFLYYLTKSAFFKKQLERQLAGMQPNFGYAHYSRIMIPLPPLAEQKRIVARLEELLPLCERMK